MAILESVPHPLALFPPKRILVPVDLSEPSAAAAAAALRLAQRWGSSLELVHVNDDTPPGLVQGVDDPAGQKRLKEYYLGLEAKVRALAAGRRDVRVRLVDGSAKNELLELTEPEEADLAVLGTHGRTGAAHLLLGSVAEAVARGSRIPVLTVHSRPADDWPARILVPMKPVVYADRALLYAAALADSLGASLTTLFVAETPSTKDSAAKVVEERVARLLGPAHAARIGRIVLEGEPAEMILRACERERFDLVALAAHRKPFWETLVLGTTAERVLRGARVPVLVT